MCLDDLFLAKTVLFDSVCCSLLFCFAIACLFERARSLEKEDSTERMRHPALGGREGGGGVSAARVVFVFVSLIAIQGGNILRIRLHLLQYRLISTRPDR